MPRFYFNIRQGNMIEIDHDGRNLENLDSARQVAAESVLALLKLEEKEMTGAVVEICDENRDVAATVPVDKAARLSASSDPAAARAATRPARWR